MAAAETPVELLSPCPAKREYWRETLRPFCNLIFLAPLLIAYELGVLLGEGPNGQSIRNGADTWMRLWLQQVGIDFWLLLPVVLIAILLICHLRTHEPWRMHWDTLGGMTAESFLYAFVLIIVGQLTDFGFRHASWTAAPVSLQIESSMFSPNLLSRLVTFMGAGIYEEFLFRLCLLPLAYAVLRALLIPKRWAIAMTAIISSFVFSLAHYLGPSSDQQMLSLFGDAAVRVISTRELWFGFVFRTLAGMFFAFLFFCRGFGIAVGAHTTYDVVVGVVLISEI
jgi:hypothetical protein